MSKRKLPEGETTEMVARHASRRDAPPAAVRDLAGEKVDKEENGKGHRGSSVRIRADSIGRGSGCCGSPCGSRAAQLPRP